MRRIIIMCIVALFSFLITTHLRQKIDSEIDRAPNLCCFLDEHLRQKTQIEKNNIRIHSIVYVIVHYIYAILQGKKCIVFTPWSDIYTYAKRMADICKAQNVDVLIGIMSGGAYLAQLCSRECNISVYYAKVKLKKRSIFQKCIRAGFTKTREINKNAANKQNRVPVILSSDSEDHDRNIEEALVGKRVAVIDDGVLSGDTMRAVELHALNRGATSILRLALHGYVDAKVQYMSENILCYGPYGYM